MLYDYVCDMCGCEYEVSKPAIMASREEICEHCHVTLRRTYHPVGLNFLTLTVREKGEIVKHRLETGNDLVCIGDDRKALERITPKAAEYDLPREVLAKMEG